MTTISLAIAIPTYKRLLQFSRLLRQISTQLIELPPELQACLAIYVFENPSSESSAKEAAFNCTNFGRAVRVWSINHKNIGADANIQQAYESGSGFDFIWVLGDDEQLVSKALVNILSKLQSIPKCGLLLLSDTMYKANAAFVQQEDWENYSQLARQASFCQPHFLLAHTLISANIISSAMFCSEACRLQREVYAPRAGLPYSFAHSVGFLTALSAAETYSVNLLVSPVIDTSSRVPPLEDDVGSSDWDTMKRLYRHHLCWLCSEFGLDIELIRSHPSVKHLFKTPFLSGFLRVQLKRIVVKFRNHSPFFCHE